MKLSPLQFEEFKKEHIPEYLQYAYHSYKANNPLHKNSSQLKFNQNTTPLLDAYIDAAEIINQKRGTSIRYNRFIRIDGKMAMADFSCDFHYFMKELLPRKIFSIHYEAIPEQFLKEIPEFRGLMLIRMAIRIQFQGLGLFELFEREKWEYLLKEGYEYGIHMVFNPIILRRFQRYGAEVTHIKSVVNQTPIQARKYKIKITARSSL